MWRERRALRRIGIVTTALVAAGLLASCATTVDGSGSMAGGPSGSAPGPSGSGGSVTGFPSQSTGSTATPVPESLRRTPVSTPLGDPATMEVCDLVPDTARSKAFAPSDFRYAGSCTKRAGAGATRISLGVEAENPKALVTDVGGAPSSAGGVTVITGKFSGGTSCARGVYNTAVGFYVYALQVTGATQNELCPFADVVVKQVKAALIAGRPLPTRKFTANTLTTADMCKTVRAAGLTSQPELSGNQISDALYGVDCALNGPKFSAYLDVATVTAGYDLGEMTTAESRELYVRDESTSCDVAYRTGDIDSGGQEILQLSLVSNTSASASCSSATTMMSKVADALQLN